jgi:hypothetical protein
MRHLFVALLPPLRASEWTFIKRFPDQNFVCIPCFHHYRNDYNIYYYFKYICTNNSPKQTCEEKVRQYMLLTKQVKEV